MANKKEVLEEPLEKQLWKAADKLRKNIDAAQYKHVVLGLIFLRYISVSFEQLYDELVKQQADGADPEDREEYAAENVFYVPTNARWSYLVSMAKNPQIGKYIDDAMDAIERENKSLKGVLPKEFARPNLDPTSIGELIDLIGNSTLQNTSTKSADLIFSSKSKSLRNWSRANSVATFTSRCLLPANGPTMPAFSSWSMIRPARL